MRSFLISGVVLILAFLINTGVSRAQEKMLDITGEWNITIKFVYGTGRHTAIIQQKADSLSGIYKGEFEEGTLRGIIQGEEIDFTGYIKHEASKLHFHYTGTVYDDHMEGAVDMGEYWSGTWTARRVKHNR